MGIRSSSVPHVYDRIFERFRIVNSEDTSLADAYSEYAEWLESPGCVFQRNNFMLDSRIRSDGVVKPGLFVTVVLKAAGTGGPRKGAPRFRYSDNSIVVMALKESTPCEGDAPRGAQMRAAGMAFPLSSLEEMGLTDDFLKLFPEDRSVFVASLKAPPRIQAIAAEMLAPMAKGRAGELLLSAHATEILARTMVALRAGDGLGAPPGEKQMRLQSVRNLIRADLRHPWTIAELARHAGLSRRSFNVQFLRLYGVSAADYLRTSRLVAAREALLHQGMSVTEAAYTVGYGNPANFSTAFRKHFGYVPSSCHPGKSS
jgi:AraC-like DNA-binding protein